MNVQQIKDKFAEAQRMGVPLGEATVSALKELENPHYVITLSGEFQVGKSTLLNKVMLGADVLLTEGVGLPTTAIPCKIVHAPTKELTVVYRDAAKAPAHYFGEAVTDTLLRSLTTAETEEARLELAKEIRHVQLGLPVEALRAYTFFDTPGVNDPNVELIERTTAETLPVSDIVLLVVDAQKQLSAPAMSYLRRAVFSAGMTRVMVLASYRPSYCMEPENRQLVLDAIRAQLASIGRDYVPVVSYTYDESVEGDILRGPAQVMDAILHYVAENKEAAKVDKLAHFLSADVVKYVESLKASIEVSGKSKEDIDKLKQKIESVARELDAEYNRTLNEFAGEYDGIHRRINDRLQLALFDEADPDSAVNLFVKEFDGMTNPSEIREHVDVAVESAAHMVQSKLVDVSGEFSRELERALASVDERARNAASAIAISTEFEPTVSGGWAGRLNPKLVRVLEVGATTFFMSPLYGVVAYFIDRVPVIRNILPSMIVSRMAFSSLKQSFRESLTAAYHGMLDQMKASVETVKQGIREVYAEIYEEKIAPYNEAIAVGSGKVLTEESLDETRGRIGTLERFVAETAV